MTIIQYKVLWNILSNLMDTTMNKIKEMVDVNTIVGEPITAPDGTLIIPVSKVTYGFAAGETDLPTKKKIKIALAAAAQALQTFSLLHF